MPIICQIVQDCELKNRVYYAKYAAQMLANTHQIEPCGN